MGHHPSVEPGWTLEGLLTLIRTALQVFAITNYLALFFPRAALLFELIQHMYEACSGISA